MGLWEGLFGRPPGPVLGQQGLDLKPVRLGRPQIGLPGLLPGGPIWASGRAYSEPVLGQYSLDLKPVRLDMAK